MLNFIVARLVSITKVKPLCYVFVTFFLKSFLGRSAAKEEVAKYGKNGIALASVVIGIGEEKKIILHLETPENSTIIIADSQNGRTTFQIPQPAAENWENSEAIGFEAKMHSDDDEKLRIFAVKDFACLKPSGSEREAAAASAG